MANEKGGKKSQKKEATKVEVKETPTQEELSPVEVGRATAAENAKNS